MDFSELEVFISLAQEGSFSRAGERLNRSQPAVSQAVKRLEEELGTALLDRSSRRVTLTAGGTVLLDYARQMLRLREEAYRHLMDLQQLKRGVLRLAANESVSRYLLPPLLKTFRRRFPSVKIEVHQSPSQRIPGLLLDQDIDFGFLSFAPAHRELATRCLFRDELCLALFPEHPLAGRGPLDLAQLGSESFIAHMVQTPNRSQIIDLFQREQVPLRIVMELSNLETIKDFVRAKEGLAILPRLCLRQEFSTGQLMTAPVRGMVIGRDVRLVFRASRPHSPAGAAFLDLVDQEYPGTPEREEAQAR